MPVEVLQVRALPVMIANDLAELDSDSSDDDEAVGDLPTGPRVEEAARLTSAAMVRGSGRRLLNVGLQNLQDWQQINAGPACYCRVHWQQLAFERAVLTLMDP